MNIKFCVFVLLLFTLCHGQVQHNHLAENTVENVSNGVYTKQMTGSTVTPVLQHSFDNFYNDGPNSWLVAIPISVFLLVVCCIICCECRRRRRNQEDSLSTPLTLHPPPPQPASDIFIEQHAPPPGQWADIPPPYPTQQLVPPPYDTQPVWRPSAPQ